VTKRNQIADILRLKDEKNVLILAHNYQLPEIHAVADRIGDSLELALAAREAKEPVIVVCGVRFMAETAQILNPGKTVLMPVPDAGCPLAEFLKPDMIKNAREIYPDAAVVVYINSTADCKVLADAVCTSGNAVKVVKSLPNTRVIFGPDSNLASYVASLLPDKEIIPLPGDGHCYVHQRFRRIDLLDAKCDGVSVIAHPECPEEIRSSADFVASTGRMVEIVKKENKWYICTESGMLDRLSSLYPDKLFIGDEGAVCTEMKRTTLSNLVTCMRDFSGEIVLSQDTISGARKAIDYMLNLNY